MNKSDHVGQLEAQRYAAMTAGDVDSIAAMLDPDLVYVHSSGVCDSRDTYLQALREGTYIYEKIEVNKSSYVETADTVIFSNVIRMTLRTKKRPESVSRDAVLLSVWRASSQGWRLVAMQSTTLSQ